MMSITPCRGFQALWAFPFLGPRQQQIEHARRKRKRTLQSKNSITRSLHCNQDKKQQMQKCKNHWRWLSFMRILDLDRQSRSFRLLVLVIGVAKSVFQSLVNSLPRLFP